MEPSGTQTIELFNKENHGESDMANCCDVGVNIEEEILMLHGMLNKAPQKLKEA